MGGGFRKSKKMSLQSRFLTSNWSKQEYQHHKKPVTCCACSILQDSLWQLQTKPLTMSCILHTWRVPPGNCQSTQRQDGGEVLYKHVCSVPRGDDQGGWEWWVSCYTQNTEVFALKYQSSSFVYEKVQTDYQDKSFLNFFIWSREFPFVQVDTWLYDGWATYGIAYSHLQPTEPAKERNDQKKVLNLHR